MLQLLQGNPRGGFQLVDGRAIRINPEARKARTLACAATQKKRGPTVNRYARVARLRSCSIRGMGPTHAAADRISAGMRATVGVEPEEPTGDLTRRPTQRRQMARISKIIASAPGRV